LVIAAAVRFLDAKGIDATGLVTVGTALFVNPVLAAAIVPFGVRDVQQGKGADVIYAVILSVLALFVAWWPLLQAD